MFTAFLQILYAYTKDPSFFESLFCSDNPFYRKTKKFNLEQKPILILRNINGIQHQIPYEYHNYAGYDTQLSYDLNTITFNQFKNERKEKQKIKKRKEAYELEKIFDAYKNE